MGVLSRFRFHSEKHRPEDAVGPEVKRSDTRQHRFGRETALGDRVTALQDDEWAALVLARRGLTAQRIGSEIDRIIGRGAPETPAVAPGIDGAALATLGIDLDAVRRRVEATFGPGALARKPGGRRCEHEPVQLPFTPRAKKALMLGLRESLDQRRREVTPREIVIGLLGAEGVAGHILREHGVDLAALRAPAPTASASPGTRSSRTPRRLFGRRSDHHAG